MMKTVGPGGKARPGPPLGGPGSAGQPAGPAREPFTNELDGFDELDEKVSSTFLIRRIVIRVLIITFMALPAAALLTRQGLAGKAGFLIPATAAFLILTDRVALAGRPRPGSRLRWAWVALPLLVGLAAALLAVGGMNWLTGLALAAAAIGRFSPTPRHALPGIACCMALGLGIGLGERFGYGNSITAAAVPLLAGLLAYGAERRNDLIHRLNQTRAELARVAVAEERLRISRDLHDLLGHSLSLITLKAELAGRLIDTNPQRAAKEIGELERVARQSLTEVRQAVTSYRQPTLAAELAAARRMLASAGVDCTVHAPTAYSLPPEIDALLAWTVREGATNIVRHAAARHAKIVIGVSPAAASAELADDGAGPPGGSRGEAGIAAGDVPAAGSVPAGAEAAAGGAGAAGSGLAGLAERAARLHGALSAGAGERGGFRLLVSVPLTGGHSQPEASATGQHGEGSEDGARREDSTRTEGSRPGQSSAPGEPRAGTEDGARAGHGAPSADQAHTEDGAPAEDTGPDSVPPAPAAERGRQ